MSNKLFFPKKKVWKIKQSLSFISINKPSICIEDLVMDILSDIFVKTSTIDEINLGVCSKKFHEMINQPVILKRKLLTEFPNIVIESQCDLKYYKYAHQFSPKLTNYIAGEISRNKNLCVLYSNMFQTIMAQGTEIIDNLDTLSKKFNDCDVHFCISNRYQLLVEICSHLNNKKQEDENNYVILSNTHNVP